MVEQLFDIDFMHDDQLYKGRVNPSESLNHNGSPSSFHVVLNNVNFGNLFLDECRWNSNEERPGELVKMIGKQIEKHYQL